MTFFQDLIKEFSVFCSIYVLCGSTKNLNSHLHQRFCQFNGCLTTELYHCAIWFFNVYYIFHIFRSQWFKIQLICNIKVCTYCFGVIVNDNRFIIFFFECPGTMNRTEVKFDSLTDTNRTGTKNQNFLSFTVSDCFIFAAVYRIIIGSFCCKFCCTGIYHLICCGNSPFFSQCFDFFCCFSCQRCDHMIREFDSLCFPQKIFCQFFCFQCLFHFD